MSAATPIADLNAALREYPVYARRRTKRFSARSGSCPGRWHSRSCATATARPAPSNPSCSARFRPVPPCGVTRWAASRARSTPPLRKCSASCAAAEKLPDSAEIQFHLGMTRYKLGQAERARQSLRRALELDPKLPALREAEQVLVELK